MKKQKRQIGTPTSSLEQETRGHRNKRHEQSSGNYGKPVGLKYFPGFHNIFVNVLSSYTESSFFIFQEEVKCPWNDIKKKKEKTIGSPQRMVQRMMHRGCLMQKTKCVDGK